MARVSINLDKVFRASRYDKGGADYLNIPLDREAYETFVNALVAAEKVAFKDFEADDLRYFEGCLPIEVMAERGIDTLRYGPMKPVGLVDPATGRRPGRWSNYGRTISPPSTGTWSVSRPSSTTASKSACFEPSLGWRRLVSSGSE